MRKRQFLLLFVLFFLTSVLSFSGDIAAFVNLGFSEDSEYFLFGQYGVLEETTQPYAEIFTVRVSKNSFAPNGVFHGVYSGPVEPGYEGFGALLSLYADNTDTIKKFNIDHIKTGRILYILLNGEKPKPELSFRDFYTGHVYTVSLVQNSTETEGKTAASFYINLTVTDEKGKSEYFTVGLPDYKRPGVKSYSIRKILISPDRRSLVFVVEKEEVDSGGANIRYMVETVRVR